MNWCIRTEVSLNLLESAGFLIQPERNDSEKQAHLANSARLIKEMVRLPTEREPSQLQLILSEKERTDLLDSLVASHSAILNQPAAEHSVDALIKSNSITIGVLANLKCKHSGSSSSESDSDSTEAAGGQLTYYRVHD